MQLPHPSQLHLWHTRLDENLYIEKFLLLLNSDEVTRAERFKLALHRKRFIIARAALRSILGLYLKKEPQSIQIEYNTNGKPQVDNTTLRFNLSHSHDIAIFAIANQSSIGVDIEKIHDSYNDSIAKRFFNPEEYALFSELPPEQKIIDFYRIWTEKEAVVKALGEGIGFSLSSFRTSPTEPKTIIFNRPTQGEWYLQNIDRFPGYQAAVVTSEMITEISYREWLSHLDS